MGRGHLSSAELTMLANQDEEWVAARRAQALIAQE